MLSQTHAYICIYIAYETLDRQYKCIVSIQTVNSIKSGGQDRR